MVAEPAGALGLLPQVLKASCVVLMMALLVRRLCKALHLPQACRLLWLRLYSTLHGRGSYVKSSPDAKRVEGGGPIFSGRGGVGGNGVAHALVSCANGNGMLECTGGDRNSPTRRLAFHGVAFHGGMVAATGQQYDMLHGSTGVHRGAKSRKSSW